MGTPVIKYPAATVDGQIRAVVTELMAGGDMSVTFVTPSSVVSPNGSPIYTCQTNGANMSCTGGGNTFPLTDCTNGSYFPGGNSKDATPAVFCSLTPSQALKSFQQIPESAGVITPTQPDNIWIWIIGIIIAIIIIAVIVYAIKSRPKTVSVVPVGQ